ncbi:unnamed protein product [Cyclocybe aegerita]|uniref:Uncharacterized protein n=1 Tax=Cyclocybe aegerita TaxID=1973307 RepID=A0A8S0W010_CYCAE|nr:unnamed protein product [Cyclocybe aegerita]
MDPSFNILELPCLNTLTFGHRLDNLHALLARSGRLTTLILNNIDLDEPADTTQLLKAVPSLESLSTLDAYIEKHFFTLLGSTTPTASGDSKPTYLPCLQYLSLSDKSDLDWNSVLNVFPTTLQAHNANCRRRPLKSLTIEVDEDEDEDGHFIGEEVLNRLLELTSPSSAKMKLI